VLIYWADLKLAPATFPQKNSFIVSEKLSLGILVFLVGVLDYWIDGQSLARFKPYESEKARYIQRYSISP
jgi:hypothetical protein